MYELLGNAHAQEVVRQLNPDPKTQLIHCKLLKKNSNACNSTPLPGGTRGVCPHNPYHPQRQAERDALWEQYHEKYAASEIPADAAEKLHTRAAELHAAIEMGLISDLSQLTPAEFLSTWNFRHQQKTEEARALAELQAKLTVSELGKALARGGNAKGKR